MRTKSTSETALADLTGITPESLAQLADLSIMPAAVNGHYATEPALRGLFAYLRQRAKSSGGTLADERRREAALRTSLLEIDLAERRGDLIGMERAQKMIGEALLPLRQKILAMPNNIAAETNPSDVDHARQALQRWVDAFFPAMRKAMKPTKSKPLKKRAKKQVHRKSAASVEAGRVKKRKAK